MDEIQIKSLLSLSDAIGNLCRFEEKFQISQSSSTITETGTEMLAGAEQIEGH